MQLNGGTRTSLRIVTGVYAAGRSSDTNSGSGAIMVSTCTALKRMIELRACFVLTTRCGVAFRTARDTNKTEAQKKMKIGHELQNEGPK